MDHNHQTIEIARQYEKQGYLEDAFEIYSSISKSGQLSEKKAREIEEALNRLKNEIPSQKKVTTNNDEDSNIAFLFEKWLRLMILKHRFNNFNNIRARL